MATRIIIDTNIVISLEGNAPVSDCYSQLLALLQLNGVCVLVHPASLDDIENDKDEARKSISLSKLRKYSLLEAPPPVDVEFLKAVGVGINGVNDLIDCTILTALLKDAVHFLITEDRGLHTRARVLKLGDRVLTAEQALSLFSAVFEKRIVKLPNLEPIQLHQVRDELQDKLFDSLRSDYPNFDKWFIDACQAGRRGWIARDFEEKLGAICIYKEEIDPQVTADCRLTGRILKLCTFKVERNVGGQKIGELLLKAAFKHATQNKYEKIYVTVKSKHVELIDMLSDFGFEAVGVDMNSDDVFVKDQPLVSPESNLDPIQYHVRYSPYFKAGAEIGKFLVPIQPAFHAQLFPEASSRQLKLPFAGPTPGNAIKLAYLCKANLGTIKSGDVLVFYRSEDFQSCTTIGIVESVERLVDADMILERVLKRTVYVREEIEKICATGCLTMLFRLQGHLPSVVTMNYLESLGIKGPIQTIRKISHEQFLFIAKQGQFEDSISPN